MAKQMKTIAIWSFLLTLLLVLIYQINAGSIFMTCAITFGTIAYHFWMRLFVGFIFDLTLKNRVDYHRKWFQVSLLEQRLYKKLNVKKWKGKMPTYDMDVFDKRKHSWDEIAQAMCQAELVHETIMLLSFVPILAYLWFGALEVFIITSILAAGFDGMFVIIQRFNRSRVINMIK